MLQNEDVIFVECANLNGFTATWEYANLNGFQNEDEINMEFANLEGFTLF